VKIHLLILCNSYIILRVREDISSDLCTAGHNSVGWRVLNRKDRIANPYTVLPFVSFPPLLTVFLCVGRFTV
jgi:hypothetical protein